MTVRTGARYTESPQKKPREVGLRGGLVDGATRRPALKRPIERIARL
ncbi:hypothetical protein [Streptomyces sp. Root264]|nr:hypothetical protein [Streptomyces sp. Root264]